MELTVVIKELVYDLPYIGIGLLVWRIKSDFTLVIIAVAWLSHGLYDFYHDLFFVNPGFFGWYRAFCGFVDLVAGIYLLTIYRKQRHSASPAA